MHKIFIGKKEGSAHILILSIMSLFLILVFMIFSLRHLYVRSTWEKIDDGLSTALLAAGVLNIEEYGRSGQIMIHNDLPDELFETEEDLGEEGTEEGGQPPEEEEERIIYITEAEGLGDADEAIRKAGDVFLESLKANLGLDDAYLSKSEAIASSVKVESFIIYNVFRDINSDGEYTGTSKLCKYEFVNGNWVTRTLGSAGSERIRVSDLIGESYVTINNTSVYAKISFDMKRSGKGEGGEEGRIRASYARAIDVTVN